MCRCRGKKWIWKFRGSCVEVEENEHIEQPSAQCKKIKIMATRVITIHPPYQKLPGYNWDPQCACVHGLFVGHQGVSGVVISTTRPGSPFWDLCVPPGCKFCGYFNHKVWITLLVSLCAIRDVSGVVISTTGPGLPSWPLCVPLVCKWCIYFNHKAWLTSLASLCT